MRILVALAFLFAASFVAGQIIPDRYIVIFHPDTTVETVKKHFDNITAHPKWSSDNQITSHYRLGSFVGYAGKIISNEMITYIAARPEVAYYEPDAIVTKYDGESPPQVLDPEAPFPCSSRNGVPWGLSRISQRTIVPNGPFHYPTQNGVGAGVRAYVIDTGCLTTHVEFTGRCHAGANYILNEQNVDLNGHGTHVGGTIGGSTVGVAPGATIICVKVLNASGSGTLAGVIDGVNWTGVNATTGVSKVRATANLSLGSGRSQAVNDACDALVAKGVVTVVASGNSNANACNYSPASAPRVVSVVATSSSDVRAYFSNYGICTHIAAPGVDVRSAWIGGTGSNYNTISGTSMASPHVCGVVTALWGLYDNDGPDQITERLLRRGVNVNLQDMPTGTPNLLAQYTCEDL